MTDPIDKIEWISAYDLIANNYNPNAVFSPELKALEKNILSIGWVQPVIISKDKTIIDGFHRTMLSMESKKIKEKYNGKVPCVVFI